MNQTHHLLASLSLAAVLGTGCGRSESAPGPAPAPAPVSGANSAPASDDRPEADDDSEPAEKPEAPVVTNPSLGMHLERGRAANKKKAWDEAMVEFEAAMKLDDKSPHVYAGRGFAKLGKLDFPGADADFTKGLELAVALGEGGKMRKLRAGMLFNRGLVAEGRGDAEGAKAFFQQAYDLHPNKPIANKLGLPVPERKNKRQP